MTKSLCFLLAAALLSGCNKADPRTALLEARVTMLESNLVEQKATESTNHTVLLAYIDAVNDLVSNLMIHPVLPEAIPLDPNAGLPIASGPAFPLDPNTGLPLAQSARVVRVANRVTETNDLWWRWSVTVYIANPTGLPMRVNARINFLDRDGFIIETKDMYRLNLDGSPTNSFSSFDLVQMPGARKVASIRGEVAD